MLNITKFPFVATKHQGSDSETSTINFIHFKATISVYRGNLETPIEVKFGSLWPEYFKTLEQAKQYVIDQHAKYIAELQS